MEKAQRTEYDNNNDLAHTENPSRRIKPPQRDFIPFQAQGSPEIMNGADNSALGRQVLLEMPVAETSKGSNVGTPWRATATAHGVDTVRIRVSRSGDVPESWAVESLPPLTQCSAAVNGDAFTVAGLTIGEWRYHPEALRFSLSWDGRKAHFYGMGEKIGRLERSGRVWEMWNTDEPEHLPSRDPLYVSIPFTLFQSGDQWYGLFVDNPARQYWDLSTPEQGCVQIDVEDEYLDMYLFSGGGPREILRAYTRLTGLPSLPPLWGLGYHQSRYSYYPEAEVRRIASEFRRWDLPADVLHFDIDYMQGYRVFTWNKEGFPDPQRLIGDLHREGFRVVTIVDPGVKVDQRYHVYKQGKKAGYFCTLPDGKVYQGAVWPGKAAYPDFSRSVVRSWWASLHDVLFDKGVDGIWNDMNEPADFTGDPGYRPDYTVPNELMAQTDTETPVSFKRFHNLFAEGMNRASREAFSTHIPEKRSFIITRSGYAGLQRYAGVWTGDNCSWWEHLAAAVPMLLNLSLSGVSLVGADVGGFQEDASAQLYARWFSFAAFTPYFRGHSADDTKSHEPWSFGDKVLDISRHYLKLRYGLLPYLYTAFYRSTEDGEPVMKPLFFEWPGDRRLAELNDEYLLGDSVLVAPVVAPDRLWRHVYLPEGLWYDFWDDASYEGGRDYLVPAPVERLPLFVRGGSILPHEKARLHTSEKRDDTLQLDIYPDSQGKAAGVLYQDEEDGWSYREGEYSLLEFSYRNGVLRIQRSSAGYDLPWSSAELRVHSPASAETEAPRVETADPLKLEDIELPEPFARKRSDLLRIEIELSDGEYSLSV